MFVCYALILIYIYIYILSVSFYSNAIIIFDKSTLTFTSILMESLGRGLQKDMGIVMHGVIMQGPAKNQKTQQEKFIKRRQRRSQLKLIMYAKCDHNLYLHIYN